MSVTSGPASPPQVVHLDPATGASSYNPPVPAGTRLKPAHVSTHPASNLYRNSLYTAVGVAVVAATAYAGYRFYSARQQAAASAPAQSGVVEKRAPYPVVELTDESQFDSVLAAVEAGRPAGARVYVLVEGAKDSATGQSWCGDCVTAEPVVERVFAESAAAVSLIRAEVGRAAYKGNPSYAYRVHPQLQLQRIPTLYRFRDGQVEDQLIETELHDVDKVRKFVNKQ